MTDKAIHRELGLPYSKAINFDDVARLVQRRVAETEDLDFKQILQVASDAAPADKDKREEKRREFAKDVCAMANSGGGCLVFGVTEKNDRATGINKLSLRTHTQTELQDVLTAYIQPVLRADIRVIPVPDAYPEAGGTGDAVVVVSTPGSDRTLYHLRFAKGDDEKATSVPIRLNSKTHFLSVHEIRDRYQELITGHSADTDIVFDTAELARLIGRKMDGVALAVWSIAKEATVEKSSGSIHIAPNPDILREGSRDSSNAMWFLSDPLVEPVRSRGYRREIWRYLRPFLNLHSEAHLYDDGRTVAVIQLSGVADRQPVPPTWPDTPEHCRRLDLEHALAEAFNLAADHARTHSATRLNVYAELVPYRSAPIKILEAEPHFGYLVPERPHVIDQISTVMSVIENAEDEEEIARARYDVVTDVLNQAEIESPLLVDKEP